MNTQFYFNTSYEISELITKRYSTSFSLATSLMDHDSRSAIYAIYGFVRIADEIVDSFSEYDQLSLLNDFETQLNTAMRQKISTSPTLNAFVNTVYKHNIPNDYIKSFLDSMRADLSKKQYTNKTELNNYIYGSADVVGLMCLKVFCRDDNALFNQLQPYAMKLGSAFQKVNFLRDLHSDQTSLGRNYFPEVTNDNFNANTKLSIENEIEEDFNQAWIGIKQIPGRPRLAVAIAYFYYRSLLNKIKRTPPSIILNKRVRVCDTIKYMIFIKTFIQYKLKLL